MSRPRLPHHGGTDYTELVSGFVPGWNLTQLKKHLQTELGLTCDVFHMSLTLGPFELKRDYQATIAHQNQTLELTIM